MIYDITANELLSVYDVSGANVPFAYNVGGDTVFPDGRHVPNVRPVGLYKTITPKPYPWTQGGALYNNTLVVGQASDGLATIAFYDVDTGAKLGEAQLENYSGIYHANTMAFSDELHSGNTDFPYLYINEYYGNAIIGVFDIGKNGNTYYAVEIQTIDTSSISKSIIGNGYKDFMLDIDSGILYLVTYNTAGTYEAVSGNTTIITAFNLPATTIKNVVLTDADVIERHEIPVLIYARQETVYYDGFAYILSGSRNSGKVYIIDCETWELFKVVELQQTITDEPETLYFDGGYMYIMGMQDIYKFRY